MTKGLAAMIEAHDKTCCKYEVVTPYCPWCGRFFWDRKPLFSLLAHLEERMKKAESALRRTRSWAWCLGSNRYLGDAHRDAAEFTTFVRALRAVLQDDDFEQPCGHKCHGMFCSQCGQASLEGAMQSLERWLGSCVRIWLDQDRKQVPPRGRYMVWLDAVKDLNERRAASAKQPSNDPRLARS